MNVGREVDELKQTELFAFMHVTEPFKDETQPEANISWQSEMSAKRSSRLSLALNQWSAIQFCSLSPFPHHYVLLCGIVAGFNAKIKQGQICKR